MTAETMSPAQRKAVTDWLRAAADLLHLRDWRIDVLHDPPDDTPDAQGLAPWASTVPISSYRRATIQVSAAALREPPGDLLRILVHELIHLHHSDLLSALWDVTEPVPDAAKLIEATVRRYIEALVDRVAVVIVELVELPDIQPVIDARPLSWT